MPLLNNVSGIAAAIAVGGGNVEPMDLGDNEADPRLGDDQIVDGDVEVQQAHNPTLDLDQYAANYDGLAKVQRLLYLADHCPSLRIDALTMLVRHLQGTFNVQMYQTVHHKLQQAAQQMGQVLQLAGPDLTNGLPSGENSGQGRASLAFDQQWVEQQTKRAQCKLEKLDTDLKHYKSNSIKESIRRGQDDLGEHYLDMGNLTDALKCFSRARDYCTSCKHLLTMCFNVIRVSIYLQNWSLVMSYVNRAENTADIAQPQAGKEATNARNIALSKLRAGAGLADLANRKYKAAAKNFLQVSFDHFDYRQVLSAHNIAAYGALCALATFDRTDLQKQVIGSSGFKQFLELEPQLNDVIRKFNDSEYDACLRLLDEVKDNLLLDMYLAPHLNSLYAMIRNRGLVQYFSPYLSADMHKMASAFNTTVDRLEHELMDLILDGQIKARIDSHNKVLYNKDVDQRCTAYEKSLLAGKLLQRKAKTVILRSAVHRVKVCVKLPPKNGSGSQPSGNAPLLQPQMSDSGDTPSNSGHSSPQH